MDISTNPTVWRAFASALDANGLRTIAPTLLPGDERELFLDAFADVVKAATTGALTNARPDGVAPVGGSMGAQVAELAARNLGDTVRALVILSAIPLEGLALPDEVAGPLRGCGGPTTSGTTRTNGRSTGPRPASGTSTAKATNSAGGGGTPVPPPVVGMSGQRARPALEGKPKGRLALHLGSARPGLGNHWPLAARAACVHRRRRWLYR
jgi:pimeloyl-ACP methyl ester carboxylesterase